MVARHYRRNTGLSHVTDIVIGSLRATEARRVAYSIDHGAPQGKWHSRGLHSRIPDGWLHNVHCGDTNYQCSPPSRWAGAPNGRPVLLGPQESVEGPGVVCMVRHLAGNRAEAALERVTGHVEGPYGSRSPRLQDAGPDNLSILQESAMRYVRVSVRSQCSRHGPNRNHETLPRRLYDMIGVSERNGFC